MYLLLYPVTLLNAFIRFSSCLLELLGLLFILLCHLQIVTVVLFYLDAFYLFFFLRYCK